MNINSLKIIRDGRLQIETGSKEEIGTVTRDINKCRDKLEVNVHRLRNSRLVIYNIPETITIRNIEVTLLAQNLELNLKTGDITAKFSNETETNPEHSNRSKRTDSITLIQKKVKLGWPICSIEDYLVANRFFKCSRFNDRFPQRRGTETCPSAHETTG